MMWSFKRAKPTAAIQREWVVEAVCEYCLRLPPDPSTYRSAGLNQSRREIRAQARRAAWEISGAQKGYPPVELATLAPWVVRDTETVYRTLVGSPAWVVHMAPKGRQHAMALIGLTLQYLERFDPHGVLLEGFRADEKPWGA